MNEQSNTQRGPITVLAAEALAAGLLAVLDSTGQAALPDSQSDLALHLVLAAATAGAPVDLQPIHAEQQIRIRLKGSCAVGDTLHNATADGTDDGKVAVQTAPGTYFSPGVAMEDGDDGQLVLVRPCPRLATIASATIADPAGGTTTDAEARTAIDAILAALETAGIVASA